MWSFFDLQLMLSFFLFLADRNTIHCRKSRPIYRGSSPPTTEPNKGMASAGQSPVPKALGTEPHDSLASCYRVLQASLQLGNLSY